MELSLGRKRRFFRDGFLKIPGAVPENLVAAALREIERRARSEKPSFAGPDVFMSVQSSSPALMELLYATPLWKLSEALLGEGRIEPCSQAQMALRYPAKGKGPASGPTPNVHIDSWHTKRDPGSIIRHTMTVGVLLSDLPRKYMGNPAVFPGSHALLARQFKKSGIGSLPAGLVKTVREVSPFQLTGKKGDAYLMHYQLVHGIENNYSPNIRYMAYFRLYHADAWRNDSKAYLKRALTDPWLEWDGLKASAGRTGRRA